MVRINRPDLGFLLLLCTGFAVQVPLAWLLWSMDSSSAGLVRGAALVSFVFPVVVLFILWWGYLLLDTSVLRLACWYATFIVVWKAIIILAAFLTIMSQAAIYSTNFIQVMYPAIPTALVVEKTRKDLGFSARTIVLGILAGVLLASFLVAFSIYVLFLFRSLLV